MIRFVSGGSTPVISARVVQRPRRYVSLLFGGVSLAVLLSALVPQKANPLLAMGSGGVERWVFYPLVLTGFGGYPLGQETPSTVP